MQIVPRHRTPVLIIGIVRSAAVRHGCVTIACFVVMAILVANDARPVARAVADAETSAEEDVA